MKLKVIKSVCDNCKKENLECVVYTSKICFFFTKEVKICQSCVSKGFRSFRKDK